MKITVIIPTLNEGQYLPKLLESLKKQTFSDFEIIVADSSSKDDTPKIAKKYGAKVIEGGKNPAAGRNNGAKFARGHFLYFFDADVKLPKNFLEKSYDEIEKRYLDLATCEFKPLSNLKIDKIMHNFVNLYTKINQFSDPHAAGFCIFVSRRLFERVGGFDESLKMAEDHDFVKRASAFRPLRVLESSKIYVSVRRLRKEGRFTLLKKYLTVELYRAVKGEMTDHVIEYEMGSFHKREKRKPKERLIRIENQLRKVNKEYKQFAKRYLDIRSFTGSANKNLKRIIDHLDKVNKSFKKFELKK